MYIMSNAGSKPVGEIYMTPVDKEGMCYLVAHYYSGGDVKLLKIKKKSEEVDPESIEGYLQKIVKHMDENFNTLYGAHHSSYQKFEEKKDSYSVKPETDTSPDMEYMLLNADTYVERRGGSDN